MATLGTFFTGSALAMGGKTKAKEQGPPINATNQDEEKFIQYVRLFKSDLYGKKDMKMLGTD